MDYVMMGSALIDLVAVAVLGWMLARSARDRDAMLVDQRQTMERLRGDLGQLLEEAGERARGLERTLAERERSLRALLLELDRVEPRRSTVSAADRARPLVNDPAEARLLRDLELRFAAEERR